MKTIKMIDLLNMIARGEEVPKKIKYTNDYTWNTFEFNEYEGEYKTFFPCKDDGFYYFLKDFLCLKDLNKEVEIPETKKVIERIENNIEKIAIEMPVFNRYYEEAPIKPPTNQQLADKLNEVIDKINEMEDK